MLITIFFAKGTFLDPACLVALAVPIIMLFHTYPYTFAVNIIQNNELNIIRVAHICFVLIYIYFRLL